jgi:hypothetical protein
MSVQICPGCRGRNLPDAAACDWCGRPFREGHGSFTVRWWHIATIALLGMVVAALTGLALLNAARPDVRPQAQAPVAPPAAAPSPALPTRAATVVVATAPTPIPATTPSGSPAPAPQAAASPPPAPARYVRVANTGGLGVYLRQEPGPQGERIQPALAEGAILRLVGDEETVQAQVWRLCEHEGRNIQGWVPAQYLQATETTPTPTRQ